MWKEDECRSEAGSEGFDGFGQRPKTEAGPEQQVPSRAHHRLNNGWRPSLNQLSKVLQINIQKLPKNRTVTEETSERLYPNTFKDSEIIFNLNSEDASFDFCLTQDAQENASQYEIELEVMRKNELSRIGFFDVQLSDLDMIGSSRKSKWRKISSLHKRFQTIELKYGIFPIQPLNESPKNRKGSGTVISVKELKQNSFEESNPFYTSKIHEGEEKTDSVEMKNNPIPNFQPGSCIMVDIIYKKLQKKDFSKIILRIVNG